MQSRPVITAILILGAIGLAAFILWPDYQEFRRTSKELDLARKELSSAEDYFNELGKTKERLEEHEDKLAQLDAALSNRLSVPEFFIYLQQAAGQNGLILGDLKEPSVSASGLRPDIKEHTFELSFKGQYSALKNLLSSFYRNAKLIEVNAVSFSSPGDTSIFDFEIKVRTYSY